LTGYEDHDAVLEALKAGAHGYLLKDDMSREKLRAAIEEVLRGGAPFSPDVAQRVIGFFHVLGLAAGSETTCSTGSTADLPRSRLGLEQFVGESPALLAEILKIPAIARSPVSVLISGETGT